MNNIKHILLFFCFGLLILSTFYLYSIRSDYVPWGASLRDGLFFLAFLVVVLPLMIVLSIIKLFVTKKSIVIRSSYFIYTLLVAIPSIGGAFSQQKLLFGMLICIITFVLNIIGFLRTDLE